MQPPQNPYGQPPLPNPQGGPVYQPSPSGGTSASSLIVTGVLGLVCCGLFSIYTLVKSNQELETIKRGYGNVADQGTYNIARILGIIGIAFWILGSIVRIAGIGNAVKSGQFSPGNRTGTTTLPVNP